MTDKEVLLLLTDDWAAWEAAYAIAGINETPGFSVKTIATDLEPKKSIGGLATLINYSLDTFTHFEKNVAIILPGGYSWQKENPELIVTFIKRALQDNILVGALCGATLFLGQHGFLDTIHHTGDDIESFERLSTYKGRQFYQEKQIVVTPKIITAKETAAVDFAYELYKYLQIDIPEEIDIWYKNFKSDYI